jgi:hypothetical protein
MPAAASSLARRREQYARRAPFIAARKERVWRRAATPVPPAKTRSSAWLQPRPSSASPRIQETGHVQASPEIGSQPTDGHSTRGRRRLRDDPRKPQPRAVATSASDRRIPGPHLLPFPAERRPCRGSRGRPSPWQTHGRCSTTRARALGSSPPRSAATPYLPSPTLRHGNASARWPHERPTRLAPPRRSGRRHRSHPLRDVRGRAGSPGAASTRRKPHRHLARGSRSMDSGR